MGVTLTLRQYPLSLEAAALPWLFGTYESCASIILLWFSRIFEKPTFLYLILPWMVRDGKIKQAFNGFR